MPINDFWSNYLGAWVMDHGHLGAIGLRIGLACTMAAIVGMERASKRHFAGFRTFTLTALTAVFAAIGDLYFIRQFQVRVPLLSAGIIVGIATLNGNTIVFSSRNQLTGVTTSVALWTTGALSLCLGLGLYTPALIGFIAVLIALALFPSIELHFKGRSRYFEIHVELNARSQLADFVSALRQIGLHVDDIEINHAYANTGLAVFTVKLKIADKTLLRKKRREIIEALAALKYVHFVEEIT